MMAEFKYHTKFIAMSRKFVVFGFLSTLMLFNLCYNEAVVFKFTNFVCDNFDKSWFTFNECRLRAINRNKTILNFNGTFHQPVNELDVKIQILRKANGYKPWVINVNIDVCRFQQKPYNPVAKVIFNLIKDFSNIDHKCPYVGTAYIKGVYPRWKLLPSPFPTGDYLLAMTWSSRNKTKLKTDIYFLFKEDLINA